MERVMTVEEKIRRAEEIYQRRKQGETRPIAKVAVNDKNDKKDIKLLKKMIIQVIVSITIYLCVYIVQNNQYVFSEDFINKAKEILSYDTNFVEIYEIVKEKIMGFITQEENKEETQVQEQQEQQTEGQQEELPNNEAKN